ncbi:type IV secretory system conjugative DNA transfer family protein [Methylobacterium marchantiae]|uniref:Type IV secretory system conjugative DNA transfer family protein n=1 Tax=Methylobacterium marchantiae TaxID=600331 RepID=A0ABW3WYI9_9HYPH|nr:hypothetical protein AIGOOFII_3141 [Methylobacterium marchantiae]
MSKPARRILGLTFDGRPIFEPNANASGLIYAAMGGGKTTCGAMPGIQALIADRGQALLINDVKDGEIAAQIAPLCKAYGRKFGVVDPYGVLGADNPYRIELNPLSAVQVAHREGRVDVPVILDKVTNTLIEEPPGDGRNRYWRESPRSDFLHTASRIILAHNPRLLTPGGLHGLLADPKTWESALACEAADPDSALRCDAERILALKADNAEHSTQHHNAAVSALRLFAFPPLNEDGHRAEVTHAELLRDNWVVCFVAPARLAERLGPYFALHTLAGMEEQLTTGSGRACFILDEFCNAPLREAVTKITLFRAYGLKCLYIAQSRQDAVRRYGEREIATLEENCTVKQWFKVSNFEEAERLSRAMGEAVSVSHSLGMSSEQPGLSATLNTGRQRLFTPYELMSLPDDEQILHVAGVGFIHCRKIRQNQIAPSCDLLGPNPLEGGRLPPDPKVWLKTGTEASS